MGIADRVRTRVAGWLAPALAADVIVETAPAREPVAVARQGFEYGVPRPVINEVYSGLGASTQSDRRTCSRSTRHASPALVMDRGQRDRPHHHRRGVLRWTGMRTPARAATVSVSAERS